MISQLNITRNVRNANNGKSEIGNKTWKKNKGNNTQEEYDNKFTEAKLSGCPKERLEEMSSRENKNKTQISEQNKKNNKKCGIWFSMAFFRKALMLYSGLSPWKCFYYIQPWKTEIVTPSRVKGRHAYCPLCKIQIL